MHAHLSTDVDAARPAQRRVRVEPRRRARPVDVRLHARPVPVRRHPHARTRRHSTRGRGRLAGARRTRPGRVRPRLLEAGRARVPVRRVRVPAQARGPVLGRVRRHRRAPDHHEVVVGHRRRARAERRRTVGRRPSRAARDDRPVDRCVRLLVGPHRDPASEPLQGAHRTRRAVRVLPEACRGPRVLHPQGHRLGPARVLEDRRRGRRAVRAGAP